MSATDLDELHFSDAVPPDIPDDVPNFGVADVPPPTDDVLSCETCGTSLTYSGRGRKPKYCDEHKRSGGGSKAVAKTGGKAAPNEKLAREATQALVQINRLTGFGVRLAGLKTTAEMIDYCEETFASQAYEALLTDPGLCRQILAAGAVSAKFSLATAYAMMLGQVAPLAYMELKQKRAAKEETE